MSSLAVKGVSKLDEIAGPLARPRVQWMKKTLILDESLSVDEIVS